MRSSVWRAPGMLALSWMSFAGFAGYATLLPVAPLWAVHGGATAAGAGLVNGVLLLATVLTQLLVPAALRRFGWGSVLAVNLALLGVPALLYSASDALPPILALSAVRGVGFGGLTVTGSAAVARLVGPERRGEAIGAYGLSIAVPNVVLLPLGPWIAAHVGFGTAFVISALPLVGVPGALRLGHVISGIAGDRHLERRDAEGCIAEPQRGAYRRLARPVLLLFSVTLAGGAVITFTPQMVSRAWLATVGLFVMSLLAALSRWQAGIVADRYGAERFLWPFVLLTGIGTAVTAWSVTGSGHTRAGGFLAGMAVVGLCYGCLQNLTLVVAFDAVSATQHNLASAVWNVGFDAGTAIGSVAVGAVAARLSFATGLLLAAGVAIAVLPAAFHRR